ncbi:hypothetical protein P3L51_16260 [Streptomyces sp. PSRA5]
MLDVLGPAALCYLDRGRDSFVPANASHALGFRELGAQLSVRI